MVRIRGRVNVIMRPTTWEMEWLIQKRVKSSSVAGTQAVQILLKSLGGRKLC